MAGSYRLLFLIAQSACRMYTVKGNCLGVIMTKETLAARLRAFREAAGLTQIDLSRLAGFKNLNRVRDIEQGKGEPKWEEVECLADALGIPIEKFREIPEEPQEKPGRGRPTKRGAGPFSFSLVGYVAAGPGSLEEESPGATIALEDICSDNEGCVAYTVRGDSMVGEHILDGDRIIVRKSPDAKVGDFVVAWLVEHGAVVKRLGRSKILYSREGDWKHVIEPGDRILGVLVGVLRRC